MMSRAMVYEFARITEAGLEIFHELWLQKLISPQNHISGFWAIEQQGYHFNEAWVAGHPPNKVAYPRRDRHLVFT